MRSVQRSTASNSRCTELRHGFLDAWWYDETPADHPQERLTVYDNEPLRPLLLDKHGVPIPRTTPEQGFMGFVRLREG